jgi:hypothetical protein
MCRFIVKQVDSQSVWLAISTAHGERLLGMDEDGSVATGVDELANGTALKVQIDSGTKAVRLVGRDGSHLCCMSVKNVVGEPYTDVLCAHSDKTCVMGLFTLTKVS